VLTASPSKHYSGCHKAIEEDDEKENWRRKDGQQTSGLAE